MHQYAWEESLVATIGDNTKPTPHVFLNPHPTSEDSTKGHLGGVRGHPPSFHFTV